MELAMRWHRLLRALAFLGGLVVGLASAVFIFSNVNSTSVHWRIPSAKGYLLEWTVGGVSIWLIASVPLLAGVLAGYLYHLPARMHHFREHMRHLQRVNELEHELRELRTSLDQVLMMPEDGSLAMPAALMAPIEHPEAEPELPAAAPIEEEPVKALRPARVRRLPSVPRKELLGGLKAEITEIKLPATIPSTVVAQPRRNGKSATNGSPRRARTAPKPKAGTETPG